MQDAAERWVHGLGELECNAQGEPIRMIGTIMDITERKLAEEALRIASLYSRSLIETSLDPLVTISPEGKITDVNSATEKVTGRLREELINSDFSDYFTEPERARSGYLQAFAEGQVIDYPLALRHVSGAITEVLYNASIYRDEHGEVLGVFAAARDITERKLAEEALRQEQQFSRSVMDALPGIFYLYTYPELELVLWNKQHESLLGYTADDMKGRLATDWFLPELKEAVLNAIEGVMAKGENAIEAPMTAKDGHQLPLFLTGVKFEAQGRHYFVGTGTDLTERQRAEEALQHSEQKFRALFENLSEGVALHEVVKNAAGQPVDYRILDVNPAYELHTGLAAATAPGRLGTELYGTDAPPYLEAFTQVAWGGEPYAFETYFPPLEKHFRISVISPKHGQFATVFEDITERIRREEELRQKTAEMERFTYMISHDLKSPLVTIRTFLGYLEQDLEQGKAERAAKDMGFIRTATGKMARLLEDLLEVSRVGRVVNPPVRVSLADLIGEAVAAVAGAISTRGVAIDVNVPTLLLFGDRPRLEEVWQNLLENAVKYLGDQPNPRIELGVEGVGDDTVFYVRDNGVGIDPRFQDKVFGLFEQLDPTSEGTGLGLALVKRIVELYAGRIWLESEGSGLGTCFRFTLPLAIKPTAQGARP